MNSKRSGYQANDNIALAKAVSAEKAKQPRNYDALFVYGTLTDPVRVKQVLGHQCRAVRARLKGYKRRWGRFPYLIRQSGQVVDGLVLLNLTFDDFKTLDEYEKVHPIGAARCLYVRRLIKVIDFAGNAIWCWIYLANLNHWRADWK